MGALVIFTGNYCSGKSTAMRQRAERLHAEGREPICVDYDRIAEALGSTRSHGHSDAISTLTVRLRGLAIKAALDLHRDTGADVLIVDASPTQARLDQYRSLGAEIVSLDDVPLEELHRRASAERPPEWHRYIDEWTPVREPEPRKPWPKRPAHRKGAHGHRYERLRRAFLADKTNCEHCGIPFVTDAPCEHPKCLRRGKGCVYHPQYPTVQHMVHLASGGPSLDVSTWQAWAFRCNQSDGGKIGRARQRARAQDSGGTVDLTW